MFTIIAAIDEKKGLGKANIIPWLLPTDKKFFYKTTTKGKEINTLIMGSKTYFSMKKEGLIVRHRRKIVLSREKTIAGVLTARSLDQAIEMADDFKGENFVIGGGEIYAEAVKHEELKEILLTRIEKDFGCDVFFPEMPAFSKVRVIETGYESGFKYRILRYTVRA